MAIARSTQLVAKRWGARLIVVLPLALAMLLIQQFPSDAKSRTCVRLERQLASLSSNRRSGSRLKLLNYNSVIKRQKDHIKRANRKLHQGGCLGRAAKKKSRNRSCRGLISALRKMESNIANLRRKRERLKGGGGSTNRKRRQIKSALAANRCNRLQPVTAARRSGVIIKSGAKRKAVVKQARLNRQQSRKGRNRREKDRLRKTILRQRPKSPRNTYRTLCVRTCDGYYFPVSFSTTRTNFERDFEVCQAKCPGAEIELYYHNSQRESSEEMISRNNGKLYTSLKNAFKYRETVTPGCSCQSRPSGLETVAGDEPGGTEEENTTPFFPALPVYRMDRAEDPETLANLRGGFLPVPIKPTNLDMAAAGSTDKRKVRVVGEAFFPSQ